MYSSPHYHQQPRRAMHHQQGGYRHRGNENAKPVGYDTYANSRKNTSSNNNVGPFTLEKQVGTGSYANVWLGRHNSTCEQVAVKVIDRRKLSVENGEDTMIRHEIRALKGLSHDNIIGMIQEVETDDKIYIATEYAANGELYERLSKGRLPEHEAQRIFRQLLDSVEYIHGHNLAHRDIKPENVMFDNNDNVKLIDFGFVKSFVDSSDKVQEPCSSLWYASPEVVGNTHYHPTSVDIWGLGVILYCMVVGRRPFDRRAQVDVTNDICRGKYSPIPDHVSPNCADLIRSILVVDEAARPSLEDICSHPFVVEDIPATTDGTPIPVVKKQQQRNQQQQSQPQPQQTVVAPQQQHYASRQPHSHHRHRGPLRW